MARPRITVAVVTLKRGDEAALAQHAMYPELQGAGGYFDFGASGRPYAASPDEWVPFGDGTPIRELIERGLSEFDVDFMSYALDDFNVRKTVRLWVIDPVVLLHGNRDPSLKVIQERIGDGKAAFCTVLSAAMPGPFRDNLLTRFRTELPGLCKMRRVPRELEVENKLRLEGFLADVADCFGPAPDLVQLGASDQMFAGLGLTVVRGLPRPMLGASP